ncbi:MAG TPA: DUF4352 domain-containing protein [Actinomycetaceae bacterium]|nr:DUF4352 domain-containing protein [Actinomycetaceae bacterium]
MSNPYQPNEHGQPVPNQPVPIQYQAPAPEPKRSWFARHKILTAIIAVVVLGGIGAAIGGGDDDVPRASTSSAGADAPTDAGSPDVSQEAGEPAPADETQAAIGDTVEVGDFTVTVNGAETGISRVGNEYFGEVAQGQFVTVAVTVSNISDSAEYFHYSDQNLIDEQGREHSASTAASYLEAEDFFLTKINPGNTVEGVLLYDIPADALPVGLELSGGFLSSDVVVSLQ